MFCFYPRAPRPYNFTTTNYLFFLPPNFGGAAIELLFQLATALATMAPWANYYSFACLRLRQLPH